MSGRIAETGGTPTLTTDAGVELDHDPSRVVMQLFLPGDSTPGATSRTEEVLDRALATPPEQAAAAAAHILHAFSGRHDGLAEGLRANAAIVRGEHATDLPDDLAVIVGAAFTAEFAVEGAALCNPSAVPHPDQSGLPTGALRVLLSLRSIGESHLSSIQFCEAIIGADGSWEFVPRACPLERATVSAGEWRSDHFLRALENDNAKNDLVRAVSQELPDRFGTSDIESAIGALPDQLLYHPDSRDQLEEIRKVGRSAYRATFPASSALSQRVLLPVADEERKGVEDARFVAFADGNGGTEYRGTYTAYDGQSISSRLIATADFCTFDMHRLTGEPAGTKGMALFPRRVGGALYALSRADGEAISLTGSIDGFDWSPGVPIYRPSFLWDVVQSGNCGPPLETEEGWLVLTHGVGPMRSYAIGALLLDLDDPSRVIATLDVPLIRALGAMTDGYVPHVVYSCGAIIHDGVLWIPHGVCDDRIRVASIPVAELIGAMRRTTV